MYLSKLDLVGFKSFAQKTNLKFTKGISAIVGPNGCGKSNIVDAIRWVLGEQKTSILRSDIMENVIFNGTKNRKPINMAEVSLTIENNKNILPVEYSEVVITRRLFRSGESEYLLNNTKCRLRDIANLFMDTGLAPDSYSVIELKMVEAILSGHGEDRRGLFEEAAGIKRYKIQRYDAEKKLNNIINDLSRINDIVDEVRKNVASLQRHAQKTRRYNVLNEEYRNNESILCAFQYNKYNKLINDLNLEIETQQKSKVSIENDLNDRKNFLLNLKNEFKQSDIELNKKNELKVNVITDIEDKKQQLAVSNEKIIRIDEDDLKLENEIQQTKNKLENTKKDITRTNELIDGIKKELNKNTELLTNSMQERDTIQRNTNNARSQVIEFNNKLSGLKNNIFMLKSNLQKNNDKINILHKKIETSIDDKKSIQEKIETCNSKLSGVDNRIKDFNELIGKYESDLLKEEKHQAELKEKYDLTRNRINEINNILTNKRTTLSFYENLVDTSDTSKFLLNSKQWKNSKNTLMLSEMLSVDEELKHIVPIVINNTSDYFIVDNIDEANQAISLLKNNKKGKAGFICLASVPVVPKPNKIDINNVIGFFSEIVRVPDNLRGALRLLFDGVVVAKNSSNLKEIFSNSSINAVITLDNEYFHRAGVLRGGSISEGETVRIGKKEKMDDISNEIVDLELQLKDVSSKQSELARELNSIDIQSLRNKIQSIEADKRNFEISLAQLNLSKQKFQNELELLGKNNELYNTNITEIVEENKNIETQIKNANELLVDIETKLKNNQKELDILENDLNNKNNEVHRNDKLVLQNNNDLKNINNELERLKRQMNNYSNIIENRGIDLIKHKTLREDLKKLIENLKIELFDKEKDLANTENEYDYFSEQKKLFEEQIGQLENDIEQYQKNFDKVVENIHQIEIKRSQYVSSMQNITQNYYNNYQIDISAKDINIPDDFSEDAAIEIISELKQKLQKLGSINFAAIEDYEKESQRLQFLENQISDLLESEKTLRITIDEINQIAEKTFLDTFNKIRFNFQTLFKKLFNEEGEADIFFDASNPLESEINIMAKPPNKKPNSIEQLSGGEKTLTAISLLFAIYLVKPSPFCILDEVDAPLDDANIYRFLNIIREFSKETQFLIVTHNKTTMAAADTLYGVTMQEPGVSKTAAVRLDEIE